MTRKTIKILGITILLLTLTSFGYFELRRFFDIDSCLDRGGRWNYEEKKCEFDDIQIVFDSSILVLPEYASGREYESKKPITPKVFHFDQYTFVMGFDSLQNSSLGLYSGNQKILSLKHSDGEYDTVMVANLNNDDIPDFLISYQFEDGATLFGLLSKSKTKFKEIKLLDEWQETYCIESGDTLQYIQPLQIRDVNNDGKDDIISNLVKINNRVFAIRCTDTIFADRIK